MLPALLTPLLTKLAENGMGLLANAVKAKGKAYIEEKLGVKIADDPSPEELVALKKAEMQHEEILLGYAKERELSELETQRAATENVSKRWEADMLSDSWLSKNIRPLVLIHMLVIFDILAGFSLAGINLGDAYLALVGQLLGLVLAAYFVGRTAEKGIDIYQGWKQTKGE